MTPKEKEKLRKQLYERDGHTCHYCNIPEEAVLTAWKRIYGLDKRGRRLEIERKDNSEDYCLENCVLSCAPCNISKSNLFTYQEFERVGKVIEQIWRHRLFLRKGTDPNVTVWDNNGNAIIDIEEYD